MFCIYLRTNRDLCHLQHKLIGFYNRDENCLQRGTDWVFKLSGLRFVFQGLRNSSCRHPFVCCAVKIETTYASHNCLSLYHSYRNWQHVSAGITQAIFGSLIQMKMLEDAVITMCGTKMSTRCNGWFLLQILLLARHVSGTILPIIRSSRVLYSGCCLWYLVIWFSSCWSGVELRVMCLVCGMLQSALNRHTVRPFTESDDTRGRNNTICPPED